MSEFSVGEIAIYWQPGAQGHGEEVTITSPLHMVWIVNPPDWIQTRELVYDIEVPNPKPGFEYIATPSQLRKKRPPQDWRNLCKLDFVPTAQEETA